MPPRRPLPAPPSPAPPSPSARPTLPTATSFLSTWSDRNAPSPTSALVRPFESLSLEATPHSSRRPTPSPRSPSFRAKKPRMSDPPAPHHEPSTDAPRKAYNAIDRPSSPSPSAAPARPLPLPFPPLPRQMSYSKRHASFDGPREIPLPLPSARSRGQSPVGAATFPLRHPQGCFPELPVFDRTPEEDIMPAMVGGSGSPSPGGLNPSRAASPLLLTPEDMEEFVAVVGPLRSNSPKGKERAHDGGFADFGNPHRSPPPQSGFATSGPMGPPPPYTLRPLSHQPDAHASSSMHMPTPQRPGAAYDRSSTASLPLPRHEPYYTLPSIVGAALPEGRAMDLGPSSNPQRYPHAYPHHARSPYAHPGAASRFDDMVARSATDWRATLPQAPAFASALSDRQAQEEQRIAERPAPEPPRVLTPPPPPEPGRAPHETFLCHAPPPPEAWIAVETMDTKYVLVLNLPGVEREAITISARRRRVLHVVADGWEKGGGHFERRIKFGYDADLAGVAAEFDGDRLRVLVPRRATPPAGYRSFRD